MARIFFSSILGILAVATTGCASERVPLATEINQAAPPAVTLGPGDRIRVIVFGNDSIGGEYGVGPGGTFTMPLLGSVDVTGLTTAELTSAIYDGLSPGYLLDPQVSIEVISYRPFFILGEVSQPGQYPFISNLSVSQAVASAGGYTYRANSGRVYIRRENSSQEEAYLLAPDRAVWVRPGDTVRVGERYF